MENKRRETNAAVALMQERLQAMGILDKTSIHVRRKIKTDDSAIIDDVESSTSENTDVFEEKEADISNMETTHPTRIDASVSSDQNSDAESSDDFTDRNLKSFEAELVEKMNDCRAATR